MSTFKPIRLTDVNAGDVMEAWKNERLPRAAVIGFGRVGRGVVAPRLIDSGYLTYALDRNTPLVDEYKGPQKGAYSVLSVNHGAKRAEIIGGVWLMDSNSEFDNFVKMSSQENVSLIVTATSPISITASIGDPRNLANVITSVLKARFTSYGGEAKPLDIISTEAMPYASYAL
ncbi:MAG: hypothetical protein ABIF01_01780, partial [Candidatus Micrarchaeota archaeon]